MSELQNAEVPNNQISCDTRSFLAKGTYTEWQLFFLLRLETLLRVEEEYVKAVEVTGAEEAKKIMLLHKAIYSTYRDCIDLGVIEAAKHMFKEMASKA
ncbi:MAG: hypothetical protein HYY30_14670 [Chloroflexi bacterium]|nr:hypothetical protein [Chloroflexota bacterium]